SSRRAGALGAPALRLDLLHLDGAVRLAVEPNRLVPPDGADVDLAVGENHRAARADAHHHDPDRPGEQTFGRPALEGLVVGRLPPRARQTGVDERRDVPAGVDGERELGAVGLPFIGKLRVDHHVTKVAAELARPCVVDYAYGA